MFKSMSHKTIVSFHHVGLHIFHYLGLYNTIQYHNITNFDTYHSQFNQYV